MATQGQVSVDTTATLIYTADADGADITIGGASTDFYIGGSDVTTSGGTGGLKVPSGGYFSTRLAPSEKLYGVAAAAVTVGYYVTGG